MQVTNELIDAVNERVAGIYTLSQKQWYEIADWTNAAAIRYGEDDPHYETMLRSALIYNIAGDLRPYYD